MFESLNTEFAAPASICVEKNLNLKRRRSLNDTLWRCAENIDKDPQVQNLEATVFNFEFPAPACVNMWGRKIWIWSDAEGNAVTLCENIGDNDPQDNNKHQKGTTWQVGDWRKPHVDGDGSSLRAGICQTD